MKIIIPLQTCSTRVLNKNLRDFFDGDSLFDVKAKQLVKHFDPQKVFVSSENPAAREKVEKYNFNFLLRDEKYTGNKVKITEVVGHILSQMPDDDEDVGWVQVTAPLFSDFENCLTTWEKQKEHHDSLVVVKEIKFAISENNIPINFNFGCWHRASQYIPRCYEVLWAFCILKRDLFNECKYAFGYDPYKYVSNFVDVDIDTEQEFALAQKIYSKFHETL